VEPGFRHWVLFRLPMRWNLLFLPFPFPMRFIGFPGYGRFIFFTNCEAFFFIWLDVLYGQVFFLPSIFVVVCHGFCPGVEQISCDCDTAMSPPMGYFWIMYLFLLPFPFVTVCLVDMNRVWNTHPLSLHSFGFVTALNLPWTLSCVFNFLRSGACTGLQFPG